MTALISPFHQWKTSSESKQIFYLLTFSSSFYDLKKNLKNCSVWSGQGKKALFGGGWEKDSIEFAGWKIREREPFSLFHLWIPLKCFWDVFSDCNCLFLNKKRLIKMYTLEPKYLFSIVLTLCFWLSYFRMNSSSIRHYLNVRPQYVLISFPRLIENSANTHPFQESKYKKKHK